MEERALLGLASRQHGLLERTQVMDEMSEATLAKRIRDGRFVRVFPGVYRVAGAPITREQLLLAPCLAAGPGSAISHR